MHSALIAACCALAGLHPPLAQDWSDTGLITVDDDWSGVPGFAGYRGDGLAGEPGIDPRDVLADGSGTPVDVTANRTDPGAIGLAAGVAEFELPDPVVALRGSATASAPQLVVALDTRRRSGIVVRMRLRDVDDTADAVEPVALQYRLGRAGGFANVPGGYVADATSAAPPSVGIDAASLNADAAAPDATVSDATVSDGADRVTAVRAVLPAVADDEPLVEVRVITTNAVGRDEWVGVDDIDITATAVTAPTCEPEGPRPWPGEPGGAVPVPWRDGPRPEDPGRPDAVPRPRHPGRARPLLTGLALSPGTFTPARRGTAILRHGHAGTALRFNLSEPATLRFRLSPGGRRLRFHIRGHRGVNRMRFTGRLRGRALASGPYTLTAVATGRSGVQSVPVTARFRVAAPDPSDGD